MENIKKILMGYQVDNTTGLPQPSQQKSDPSGEK